MERPSNVVEGLVWLTDKINQSEVEFSPRYVMHNLNEHRIYFYSDKVRILMSVQTLRNASKGGGGRILMSVQTLRNASKGGQGRYLCPFKRYVTPPREGRGKQSVTAPSLLY